MVAISPMLVQALAALQAQAGGQFDAVVPPAVDPEMVGATKPAKTPEPDAAFASIPTSAYYGAVQAKSMDPFFGGGHLAALKSATEDGQDAYMEQLTNAQEQTADANQRAGSTELIKTTLENAAEDATAGIAGAGDIFGVLNQDTIQTKQVNTQNEADAENFKTIAEGTEKLNNAGVQVGISTLTDLLTPVFAEQGIDLKSLLDASGKTPKEQIEWLKAQAAMLGAEASMKRGDAALINAKKPPAVRSNKSDDSDSDKLGTGLFTMPPNLKIGN